MVTLGKYHIERDGLSFRAIGPGFRSSRFTSASQAGLVLERKFGKAAHREAYEGFIRGSK